MCIHSTPAMKIQIDKNKPLPDIHQYPLNAEAIQGIKTFIEEHLRQDLIFPCMSPCNTPVFPVKTKTQPSGGDEDLFKS